MRPILCVQRLIALAVIASLTACDRASNVVQQPSSAPVVSVSEVISERITEWDEFTGRLQALQTVELRPRVSGYIDSIAFEEGTIVKQGEPLFFIDNRAFKAQVKRLQAELVEAKSQQALAQQEYVRAQDLVDSNFISKELVDVRRASKNQADARVQSVSAELELAMLNLSYTRITAPINGRVSNALVTQGNYVTLGQSILTTLVSTKEVYAYFDADEQTYLNYMQMAQQGARPSLRGSHNPVLMGLASDKGFPYQGTLDFVDNQVNESTGTIRGRAVFDNKDGRLTPGLFARLKLIGTASYSGILVAEKAIATDLNNKYVMVLDKHNIVRYRAVKLGESFHGLRIVKSGLKAGEKILVNGLQRIRPGVSVTPQLVEMTDKQTLDALHAQQQALDKIIGKSGQLKTVSNAPAKGE